MTEAPRGSSWLQADLKKGSPWWQTSSLPGLWPSHIPLKRCTFSSSRDMISASFRLNRSAQQNTEAFLCHWIRLFSLLQTVLICLSHLSSPLLLSPVASCHLLSHWGSLHPRPSPCPIKQKKKKQIRQDPTFIKYIMHNINNKI